MILTNENIFLIILGIIWIIGAVFQDLRRREVDNIWNFSLIAFALSYRAFVSVFNWNYWFFLNGVIGLVIFLALGNLFYYSRLFAGGDAKLLIALGTILPLSYSWIVNLKIFGLFILGFLTGGSVYVLIWSFFLVSLNFKNFRHEFFKYLKSDKNIYLITFFVFLIWILISYFINLELFFIGLIFLLFPFLFFYAKAVEESCMVKAVWPNKITVGDWLHEDVYVGGKKIKANWEGVSEEELRLIKNKYRRKISVKYGIPFTPSFLIGFLGLIFISLKYGFV